MPVFIAFGAILGLRAAVKVNSEVVFVFFMISYFVK